jgi:hypothetical protein
MKRVLLLSVAACSCAIVHQRAQDSGPRSGPAHDEGMLLYTIGRLSFEAPAAWQATGDARKVALRSPADDGRIDAQVSDTRFADDRACLAQAKDALARGEAKLTNVRRHATTIAGKEAVVQEADSAGWHGWAWAVCSGGEQYRISFNGRAPLNPEAVRASRLIPSSATLAPLPSAQASPSAPRRSAQGERTRTQGALARRTSP